MPKLVCKNCNVEAVSKKDGSYVCPNCGGTFSQVDGETRLVAMGEWDAMQQKLKAEGDEI